MDGDLGGDRSVAPQAESAGSAAEAAAEAARRSDQGKASAEVTCVPPPRAGVQKARGPKAGVQVKVCGQAFEALCRHRNRRNRPVTAAASEAAASDGGGWRCAWCTFANASPLGLACHVCQRPRKEEQIQAGAEGGAKGGAEGGAEGGAKGGAKGGKNLTCS